MEASKRVQLLVYSALLIVGNCGGPLIVRSYFINGGKRVWLSAALESAGFPLLLIPIGVSYYARRRRGFISSSSIFGAPRILAAALVTGVLSATGNFLYSAGMGLLPVSTSTLIYATQLVFTAAFAFVLLGQRFTVYSINAVVLLTAGAVLLGLNAAEDGGGELPKGESVRDYVVGFVMTAASAAVTGFVLPFVEFAYAKYGVGINDEGRNIIITDSIVMEFQMIASAVATAISVVGMLANRDFQAIPEEAKGFALGETKYYVVLIFSAIFLECFFLGCNGVVSCSSSLLSGILIAVSLPITELLSVMLYGEEFNGEKGLALFLCLWGFVSYFSGEMAPNKSTKEINNGGSDSFSALVVHDDDQHSNVTYSLITQAGSDR